jgi:hypothetical protein
MKNQIEKITYMMIIVLMLAACVPAAAPIASPQLQSTIDINPIYTAAVQTYEVESTRKANLMPTATETVLPTETIEPATNTPAATLVDSTPVDTPTLWIPVSGSTYPTITAKLDTNCRLGPDTAFDVVGALRVGETSEVYGKLKGGGWWLIKNITHPDDPKLCWVWAETTAVTGDTGMVPDILPPQTPSEVNAIVNVTLGVVPATSLVCPTTFVFTGAVTTDRAVTLTYQFLRNDGSILQSGRLFFTDDGTQNVTLSEKYNKDISGWVQLVITDPRKHHSAKIDFSLDCP